MRHQQKDRTINTYDQSAESFAEYYRDIGAREDDINRAFGLVGKPQPNVVEIGCGNGRDAQYILQLTKNYIGVDLSSGMLRIAKEQNPNGRFIQNDLADFTVPLGTDIVFSFASILHSPKEDVRGFLENSGDPLADNGIVYISTKWASEYRTEVKKDEFGERLFYFYTPELLQELAGLSFKKEYLETQKIGSTDWFTLVLRKQ